MKVEEVSYLRNFIKTFQSYEHDISLRKIFLFCLISLDVDKVRERKFSHGLPKLKLSMHTWLFNQRKFTVEMCKQNE